MIKKNLFLLLIFLVFLIFGWFYYKEGLMPVNKRDISTKIFVIQKGETLNSIVKRLYKEDLIRSRLIFFLLVKKMGIEKKIQAGDFRLSPSMSAEEIAKTLTHGTLDIWITIIEGLRKEEIANIIAKNFSIPEIEFIKYAKEGYLFPDTYLFPKKADAQTIIKIMTDNFHKKFNQPLREKAEKRLNLDEEQVLILASLVEREAKFDQDRKEVASILLKRLRNDWPLQVDATVQYVLGYQSQERTWWKKNLTIEDLEIDSPYNTYKKLGLPPTPISNPGLASIIAVIEAESDTPYWYYLSDKTGRMHFAKTLEEHNNNIKKYLNQ